MSDTTTKLFDRIRKLLAKAEGNDNEAEAAIFWAKAAELMAENAVSEAQIREAAGGGHADIEHIVTPAKDLWGTKPYSNARATMLYQIGKVLGCQTYTQRSYSGRKTTAVGFVGTASSIERTKQVFRIAEAQADRAVLKGAPDAWENVTVYRRNVYRAFTSAFIEKLASSIIEYDKSYDATRGFGLVLVDDKRRAEMWAKENLSLYSYSTNATYSASGAQAGRDAGRNANIGNASFTGRKALTS